MGRRDKRTKKGKIFKGVGGKMRPETQIHFPQPWWHLPEVDLRSPIPMPPGVYAWREAREAAQDKSHDSEGYEFDRDAGDGGEPVEGYAGSNDPEGAYDGEYEEGAGTEDTNDQEGEGTEGVYNEDGDLVEGEEDVHEEDEDLDAEPGEYKDEEGYGEGDAEGLELHSDEEVEALTEDKLEASGRGPGYDSDSVEGARASDREDWTDEGGAVAVDAEVLSDGEELHAKELTDEGGALTEDEAAQASRARRSALADLNGEVEPAAGRRRR
ncbi:hypothetical protein WJX81_007390 [Elliptochloris bilobata]|uniref:Uncharacterized protein n=1 Tax=Elliptochloris bilobata TaxID=381761 RepID=A0AAW1SHF0_9CHLO